MSCAMLDGTQTSTAFELLWILSLCYVAVSFGVRRRTYVAVRSSKLAPTHPPAPVASVLRRRLLNSVDFHVSRTM